MTALGTTGGARFNVHALHRKLTRHCRHTSTCRIGCEGTASALQTLEYAYYILLSVQFMLGVKGHILNYCTLIKAQKVQ